MADTMAEKILVQVCYATPQREILLDLEVDAGTTIAQAITQSGICALLPGQDLDLCPVGIYAKKRPLDTLLCAHDRIEIYRPLVADPKESRRRRAQKKDGQRPL